MITNMFPFWFKKQPNLQSRIKAETILNTFKEFFFSFLLFFFFLSNIYVFEHFKAALERLSGWQITSSAGSIHSLVAVG